MLRVGLPKGGVHGKSIFAAQALALTDKYTPGQLYFSCGTALEVFLLKQRDIPVLVASGILDIGVTSSDWVAERAVEICCLARLPWCDTRLSLIGPTGGRASLSDASNQTVVTEYPNLAFQYLQRRFGSGAPNVFAVSGSTEALVPAMFPLGVDCVETGGTLSANSLVELEVIARASVGIYTHHRAMGPQARWCVERIQSV